MNDTQPVNKNRAIYLKNLTKKFGNLIAVNDLTFEILKGEILGFLGPNGAGKSTTINMICGLTRPTSGSVLFDGISKNRGSGGLASIGLCPQDIVCWPKLTCLEQLVFTANMYDLPVSSAKKAAEKLLGRLGLGDKRNKLSETLSGGMKRRLNLALALIHDPEIVILDEPEAGLDPQSRITVREFIAEMAENKTVILTSHNMDEVDRLAQRIAIIDLGKLLVTGTPENLKKSIGEGDILTIELSGFSGAPDFPEHIFGHIPLKFSIAGNMLTIRATNLINSVGEICSLLNKNNIPYGEITLRGNTLEDVFIQLTGRRLRE